MRPVYLLGAAVTPVAEHWERSLGDLAHEACAAALGDLPPTAVDALVVANALAPALQLQAQLGAALADACGLAGVEAWASEAGGAAGGVALRQGALLIAAGAAELVVVLGAEKVSEVLDARREAAAALSTDADWEGIHGATLTAQWALLMRRYMHEYGVGAADFAPFPVNAHARAVANPAALYRFAITPAKVAGAAPVADPLVLLDCATAADGAAAVVLASAAAAARYPGARIRLAGSAVATDRLALHARRDPLWLAAAERATALALHRAGLTIGEIGAAEFTDPHGIAAALALEASGFVARGSAVRHAASGRFGVGGALPLANAGGYKARGDLLGAAGVYQVAELAALMRSPGAPHATLAQCLGGVGATAAATVLVRDDGSEE
jgi:acetyl-CoA C-acetyltransferase